VANGRLLREKIFDRIWIQPAAGDAGGALGAALLATHMRFGVPRIHPAPKTDSQHGSLLGPAYSSAEVEAFLQRHDYPYERVVDLSERASRIAMALREGKVVGVLAGRMEFGPRSLGARSILGDPRNAETQVAMNLKIKYRESFRPFAPAVLEEHAGDYFELDEPSPYMLLVAPVQSRRRCHTDTTRFQQGDDDLLRVVKQVRSDIPAVTHVDYSARVQTVTAESPSLLRHVLEAFEQLTGCAVLVNTSFNVRGEPIVCSPQDAYRCFMRTDMDLLVLEDCLVSKSGQPETVRDDRWKQEYALD